MNLPNKLSVFRIICTIIIVFILLFPFYMIGFDFPKYIINAKQDIIIDLKYIVAGVLFVIASFTDFIDGYIARKYNLVTDTGKVLDAVADKVLVNSVLIILTAHGFIGAIIPVLIIGRDTIVDILKMLAGNNGNVVAASKLGKLKTIFMMLGITLIMFYNLPFALFNLNIAMFVIIIATGLSVASGIEYYYNLKVNIKN